MHSLLINISFKPVKNYEIFFSLRNAAKVGKQCRIGLEGKRRETQLNELYLKRVKIESQDLKC